MVEEIIGELLDIDGIVEAHLDASITVKVRKESTDEMDDYFQVIRERAVTEEELEELVADTEWNYDGCIDTLGDFYLCDRLRLNRAYDDE